MTNGIMGPKGAPGPPGLRNLTCRINRAGVPVWRSTDEWYNVGKEDEHQRKLTRWAREWALYDSRYSLYHHIPNGGRRDRRTAELLKAEGVLAGVPDVFLPYPSGGYHGLYIELKAEGGQPSKAQNAFLRAALDNGFYACICYGWALAVSVMFCYINHPEWLKEAIAK